MKMPEVKLTISVNKVEVMTDLDEIKAELSEVEAAIDRISQKASHLIDTVKGIETVDSPPFLGAGCQRDRRRKRG